ncbi:putative tick transposon, partial [Operophtera brumata]
MIDLTNIDCINLGLDSISVAKTITCDIEDIGKYLTKTKVYNLNLISQNIRSINCNMNSFTSLIVRSKTDRNVIVLTECWLPSAKYIPDLKGYNSISTTVHKTQNEGVVIYYNNNLNITYEEPQISDANCLLLKLNSETCVIGIYRPPAKNDTTSFIHSIDSLLATLSNFKNIVLCGDINIDITADTEDKRCHDYLNVLSSHSLLPAHLLPTHGFTCLDHLMMKTKLDAICFIVESSITDHECVALNMVQNAKLEYINKTFSRIDYDGLDSAVNNIDFQSVLNSKDVNIATNLFIDYLKTAIKANTQVVKIPNRKRTYKPWITKALLRCMRNRDNLHKKLKKDPSNEVLLITYKRYRNFCTSVLKKAKRKYEKEEIENAKDNKKKLWEISMVKRNLLITPLNLLKQSNKTKSVNDVNLYFSNIGKKLAEVLDTKSLTCDVNKDCFKSSAPKNSLVLLPTDEYEVFQLIMGLKNKCAVGLDQISGSIIKKYAHLLTGPVTHICNLAFTNGEFPRSFKTALIRPIYKT